MQRLVDRIRAQLEATATHERAIHEKGYLKSELQFLGATVPETRKAALRAFRELSPPHRDSVIALSGALWIEPIHELRVASVEVLRAGVVHLKPIDLALVEQRLRESRTWALVDNLAIHLAGPLTKDSKGLATLDRWSSDDDLWLRRSALLAQLIELRAGEGDLKRFSRYADGMIEETEFFIRKAIGWILREISKKRPDWVAQWLSDRIDHVAGLTLREGSRRLSEKQRLVLVAAYRSR